MLQIKNISGRVIDINSDISLHPEDLIKICGRDLSHFVFTKIKQLSDMKLISYTYIDESECEKCNPPIVEVKTKTTTTKKTAATTKKTTTKKTAAKKEEAK